MSETFQILSRFLAQFGPEVEGREAAQPPEEVRSRLEQLARGNVSEPEQEGLFKLLRKNPEWTAWLAQEVKGMRNSGS